MPSKLSLALLYVIVVDLFFTSSLVALASFSVHDHNVSTKQLSLSPKKQEESRSILADLLSEVDVKESKLSESLVETEVEFSRFVDVPEKQKPGQYVGWYQVPNTHDARMFYFFFESVNKNNPVLLWLNGGPGDSSSLGLFCEHGPFLINENLSLKLRNYSWHKVCNILYVDQPVGTGFSQTSNNDDIRKNQDDATKDLYNLLQEFFKTHEQYAQNHFYIAGENFAGHYIPSLASLIHKNNEEKTNVHIKLQGFAINNGIINPGIQYSSLPKYAYFSGFIGPLSLARLKWMAEKCKSSAKACDTGGYDTCMNVQYDCTKIFSELKKVLQQNHKRIAQSMSTHRECLERTENFLNNQGIKRLIGVNDSIHFSLRNSEVKDSLRWEKMKSFDAGIPALLESGIKVLVYVGANEVRFNCEGNLDWLLAMKWSGQFLFKKALILRDLRFGCIKKHGPLTFYKMLEAGRLVPADRPRDTFEMIHNWMQNN